MLSKQKESAKINPFGSVSGSPSPKIDKSRWIRLTCHDFWQMIRASKSVFLIYWQVEMELKKVVTKLVTDAKVELCVKNLPKMFQKVSTAFL